jgi:putative Holliday junction resolvase
LGVDYGGRRVGLALGDELGILATPLRVLEVSSEKEAVAGVVAVCREFGVECVVVGMPFNMNGTWGEMAERVAVFVQRLAEAAALPVTTWDERLSSSLVERVLLDADMSRGKRRKVRDKLAAQVILQSYLDARGLAHEEG